VITIKNVLVATDFSPVSVTALMYGRALARTFGATLHVLHVVDNLAERLAYGEAMAAYSSPELQVDLEQAAKRDLEAKVREDDRRELHAVTVLRTSSNPASAIAAYAQQSSIDVIVIGATGRGALNRMLMGSVADKVIRRAPCPVLAVRNPEHEFVTTDTLQTIEAVKV